MLAVIGHDLAPAIAEMFDRGADADIECDRVSADDGANLGLRLLGEVLAPVGCDGLGAAVAPTLASSGVILPAEAPPCTRARCSESC